MPFQPQKALKTPLHYVTPNHIVSGERNRKEKEKVLNSHASDSNQYKQNFLLIIPGHSSLVIIIIFDPPFIGFRIGRSLSHKNSSGSKISSSVLFSQSQHSSQIPTNPLPYNHFGQDLTQVETLFPSNRTLDRRNINQIYKARNQAFWNDFCTVKEFSPQSKALTKGVMSQPKPLTSTQGRSLLILVLQSYQPDVKPRKQPLQEKVFVKTDIEQPGKLMNTRRDGPVWLLWQSPCEGDKHGSVSATNHGCRAPWGHGDSLHSS